MDIANLAIVDLDDSTDRATLRQGLFETGFFHLRDHTLPPELLIRIRAETQAFFRESESRKMEFRGALRGYAALREEHPAGGDRAEQITGGAGLRRGHPAATSPARGSEPIRRARIRRVGPWVEAPRYARLPIRRKTRLSQERFWHHWYWST